MRVTLASVSPRSARSKLPATDQLVAEYLGRLGSGAGRWLDATARVFPTEAALLQAAARQKPLLVLLDSRGRQRTSEQMAAWLGELRDRSTAELWLAIGPANGWSAAATAAAAQQISLGPITLPHELARAVLAEQLFRCWAILERHPYHSAH